MKKINTPKRKGRKLWKLVYPVVMLLILLSLILTMAMPAFAAPSVADVTQRSFSSDTHTHSVQLPATIDANDLLIVAFVNDDDDTVSFPDGTGGFSSLGSAANTNDVRLTIIWKKAVGSEDGTSINFQTSGSETAVAQIYRISASSWDTSSTPAISSATTGNNDNPNSGNCSPGWGSLDILWIAVAGINGNPNTQDGTPANYSNPYEENSGSSGGSQQCKIMSASRVHTTSSEDPGSFDLYGNADWVAYTVAVKPAAGVSPASKLAFTTTPQTLTAGVISGTITVQLQDASSNPVNAAANVTVTLSSNSTGTYIFRDTGDTTDITSVTITAGTNSASFKYKDNKAGTPTITASSTDLTSATQQETVNAAAANKLGITTDPQTLTAGVLSDTITVQIQDQYGNPVDAAANVTVNLSSDSSDYVFRDTSDSGDITSVTITDGTNSASFKYKDNKAGTPNITAADAVAVLTSATQQETVNAGSPTQMIVENADDGSGSVVTAGEVIAGNSITVYAITRDDYDNFVANSDSGTWHLVDTTGGVIDSDLDASGDNKSATFTGHLVGTAKISLDPNTVGPTISFTYIDSGIITVVAGAADKLGITTPPQTLTAGVLSDTITVQLQDNYGNPVDAAADVTVTLSSNSTGTYVFRDTGDSSDITSVTITADTNSADFKYRDTKAGTPTITASSTGLTSSTQQETVNAAGVDHFGLNSPADIIAGGAKAAYTVTRYDEFDNLVTSDDQDVYLYTSSNGDNAAFYDTATDGSTITSVKIADTTSSANFWYYDGKAGDWTITASDNSSAPDGATGIGDATDDLTVDPASTHFTSLTTTWVDKQQWLEPIDFAATIVGDSPADGDITGFITFYIDSIPYGPVAVTSGNAELDGATVLNLPGTYDLTATFTSTNPNYDGCSGTGDDVTVGTRDADSYDSLGYYSGDLFAWATGDTGTATVKLAATIVDNAGDPADVTLATVSFYIDGKPVPSAQNLPVGLVTPGDNSIGIASAIVQMKLAKNQESADYLVTVVIGGAYNNAETVPSDAMIVVAEPTSGGRIFGPVVATENLNSEGMIAGKSGSPTFAYFDIQYNNSLKNPQGKMNVIIFSDRDANGEEDGCHVYRVTSNAIALLNIDETTNTAMFSAKCTVKEKVDGDWVAIDGGALMDVTLTDNAADDDATLPDAIGITVLKSKGHGDGLWFSSNWAVVQTIEQSVWDIHDLGPDQFDIQSAE